VSSTLLLLSFNVTLVSTFGLTLDKFGFIKSKPAISILGLVIKVFCPIILKVTGS